MSIRRPPAPQLETSDRIHRLGNLTPRQRGSASSCVPTLNELVRELRIDVAAQQMSGHPCESIIARAFMDPFSCQLQPLGGACALLLISGCRTIEKPLRKRRECDFPRRTSLSPSVSRAGNVQAGRSDHVTADGA